MSGRQPSLCAIAFIVAGAASARADRVDEVTAAVPFLPGQPLAEESSVGIGAHASRDGLYLESAALVPVAERAVLEGGAWGLAHDELASGGWLGLRTSVLERPGMRLSSSTFLLASSPNVQAPASLGFATGLEASLSLPAGILRPYAFVVSNGGGFNAVAGASYALQVAPEVCLLLAGGVGAPLGADGGAPALSSAFALAAVETTWRSWSVQLGAGVAAGGAAYAALAPTYLDSEHLFPAHAERTREDAEALRFSPFVYAQVKPRQRPL